MVKESSTNQLNKRGALSSCPVTFTLNKIGGRWKPLLIWNLRDGKLRYNELRKAIPSISEKMLIQQLRELEQDELVVRHVMPVVPPHVEYDLSDKGKGLWPVLDAMAQWGMANH